MSIPTHTTGEEDFHTNRPVTAQFVIYADLPGDIAWEPRSIQVSVDNMVPDVTFILSPEIIFAINLGELMAALGASMEAAA